MYKTDKNGFVTIEKNPISKVGVFDYLGSQISPELEPNKVYKVYRPEEELNNPETIESFKLLAWLPKHKMIGDGFTDAEKVGIQGVTGEDVVFENGTLYAKLKLMGKDLKNRIKNGLKELSCGFRCTYELSSGITPDGQRYDAIQKDIRGNHLASVEQGRMGKDVRIAMDSSTFNLDLINENKIEETSNMEMKELLESFSTIAKQFESIAQDMKDANEKAKEEKAEDTKEEEAKAEDSAVVEEKEVADNKELKAALDKLEKVEEKVNSIAAMDEKAILKHLSDRNDLASQAVGLVGQFDYSSMTKQEVAEYTLNKMGVACDSGHEVGMILGILAAQKPKTYIIDSAQDSSINQAIPELADLGI